METLKVLLYMPASLSEQPIYKEYLEQLAPQLEDTIHIEISHAAYHRVAATLKKYDVIHVMGAWSSSANHILLHARQEKLPTVYTPFGGMQPWVVRQHQHIYQSILQAKAVKSATVIHVCGNLEQQTLSALQLNKHVELIKNPVLTSQITWQEASTQLKMLYRKVVDSNVKNMLSKQAATAIGMLLQLGTDTTPLPETEHSLQLKSMLQDLSQEEWRRMIIYAADEHIEDYLRIGLQRLKIAPPPICSRSIDRFAPARKYPDGDLKSDEPISRNILLRSKINENIDEDEINERKLCIQLLNLRYETERHIACLRHLANVYSTLRFCDMDEDRMAEIIKAMGLTDFALSIMQRLHDLMGLTEGFMIQIKPSHVQTKTA